MGVQSKEMEVYYYLESISQQAALQALYRCGRKAALKNRQGLPLSIKRKVSKRAKSRRLGGGKRQTLTGRHRRQGREKTIMGHIISRACNQDMGNRKANLTTDVKRGSFTNHQMTVFKTSMTNAKTG